MDYNYPLDYRWSTEEIIDVMALYNAVEKAYEEGISKEEFMQYNDPSSLLREILGRVYEAQQSFENVSDLMFVYQMMYNGNSCNIRNECVHGRNYLAGGSLRFAFRVTLFAIYMIDFRIKTIKQNVSDIQDI